MEYLDDIIIFSKTVEQHLALLRDVFSRLRQAGLNVKLSICHLLQQSVHYLGHVVSAKGIETDPGKVKCVSNWPISTTSKDFWAWHHTIGASLEILHPRML